MNQQQMLSKLTMERNLAFLGTMGNNAPFIGLLGTVIGIMRAFREMNEAAGQVTTGLMSEIGEALVATAIGLIVALPSVAAYNLFQRLIKARVTRAEALGKEVLAYLKSSARSSKED
jgi:biopolymer transport protein ExbB